MNKLIIVIKGKNYLALRIKNHQAELNVMIIRIFIIIHNEK